MIFATCRSSNYQFKTLQPLIPIEVIVTIKLLMDDYVHGVGYVLTFTRHVLCGCELFRLLLAHPFQTMMLSTNRAPIGCLSSQIEAILKLKLGFLCIFVNPLVYVCLLCSLSFIVSVFLSGLGRDNSRHR